MEFDPKIALEYARQISLPRQVGTTEEKKIAQEIKAYLEGTGYRVDFQIFRFSTASEVFLFLEILAGLVIIFSTLLIFGVNQWLTFLQAGLLIFLILMIGPLNNKIQCSSLRFQENQPPTWWSSLCWKLGKWYETKNIIATLPDSSEDPTLPNLYLLAHYDSKSQYLPLVIRIALFVVLISGSLIFAALNLLSIFNALFTPISFVIGFLTIICGIPLLFLDYGNDSPGAIDDASGVGIVLHLAEVIANHPQLNEKLSITVLITSAEELAVKGALAYVKEKESFLRHQADSGGLHVLNFDGIGVDGKIYLVGGSNRKSRSSGVNLLNLIKQSAGESGIPIGRFSLPGALFDHIPFANEGYDALSLIGIGKSSSVVHSKNDSLDKLHLDGFDRAGRLATRVIEKLSGPEVLRIGKDFSQ
jgi:hypothetical protein